MEGLELHLVEATEKEKGDGVGNVCCGVKELAITGETVDTAAAPGEALAIGAQAITKTSLSCFIFPQLLPFSDERLLNLLRMKLGPSREKNLLVYYNVPLQNIVGITCGATTKPCSY